MMDDFTLLTRRPGESSEDWGGRLVSDLAQRHRRGARSPVEIYLERVPELATDPDTLGDLLVAEWTLRRQAGESFTLAEYLRRLPRWESEMAMLWQADQRLSPAEETVGSGWPAWYTGLSPLPAEFGGYRLARELVGGGMAHVFLAEPDTGGETIALKVPKLPTGQDTDSVHRRESTRQRFLREARHTHDLEHPHLCRAIEVGECEGLPYFTMPYYPAGSIADELRRRGRIPAREAVRLLIDVARGLQYAHDRGIIHRDVKPSNLLLGGPKGVVVTDFGLALPVNEDVRLTSTGHMLGTPLYFSPEQALGQELGPASDIFGLGVVLYEMLCGRAPFLGQNGMEVSLAIQSASPTPLEQMVPDLPPDLGATCRRAMAKEPGDRYPSMTAFADDLQRFLDGSWSSPRPSRSRSWLMVGVLLLLSVFLGAVLFREYLGGGRQQEEPKSRAVASTRTPIGYRGLLQGLHDDLDKLDASVRPHVRYFSLMAVHDNPYVSDADFNAHLPALQRVLNRLSRDKAVVPIYLDPSGCLARVDLRDLGWHKEVEWRMLLNAEPYGIRYDGVNPDEALRKLARETYALAGVNSLFEIPVVRADWLIATASEPPLLDELLQIDGKDRHLPAFETAGPDDPLAIVARGYREPLDAAGVAAELGLGTLEELDARWPADRAESRTAFDRSIGRDDWAGEEGTALFAACVRTLKLGVPRAAQALR
jgi:serine/threonine protein kinase